MYCPSLWLVCLAGLTADVKCWQYQGLSCAATVDLAFPCIGRLYAAYHSSLPPSFAGTSAESPSFHHLSASAILRFLLSLGQLNARTLLPVCRVQLAAPLFHARAILWYR